MPGMGELFVLVFLMIALAGTAFWIVALVDCVKYEPPGGNERVMWILIVALAGWIGALVYWLVRRPQRRALIGQ